MANLFGQDQIFRSDKKIDGETAVNSEFNFPKRRIWFPGQRDCDAGCGKMQMSAPSTAENADVCSQCNSVWGSCSARLGVFRLAIRKIGGGLDFAKIDAQWRKRNGMNFRLQSYRLLTRP